MTGTFDNWQGISGLKTKICETNEINVIFLASIQMTPVSTTNIHNNLFYVTIAGLDFSKDIQYKFVVDGEWCYDMKRDHITEACKYFITMFKSCTHFCIVFSG